jgi:GDP-4-dehydro-6-deoxy-D-mannose reductase
VGVRVLITGAGGFVGRTLTDYLRSELPNAELHGTQHPDHHETLQAGVERHPINLCDPNATRALIEAVRPDHIYHLAGQAFVPRSFEDPWESIENNVRGQLNLTLACIAFGLKPRFLIAGSAEIYGAVTRVPISEDAPLVPNSPYSVSKAAQDMLGYQYHVSHDIPFLRARAFNHFGPGQSDRFVAPAFAMQVARIEAGLQEPVMRVGDLSAKRDFTDVRDVVRAYKLLIDRGEAGGAYNIASGQARSIRDVLDILLSLTDAKIDIQLDPARLRPSAIPVLEGDITRITNATGWTPQIPFETTLRDLLDDCRRRVASDHPTPQSPS